jgi:thiosulfate dehydrogenase
VLLGMLVFSAGAGPRPPTRRSLGRADQGGEYVARLGDCVACHTSPNGAAAAGGLELENAVRHHLQHEYHARREDGLGTYTFAQFDRAMRKAWRRTATICTRPCPTLPTPKITPDDMQALYAYLQRGVAPWRKTAKRT